MEVIEKLFGLTSKGSPAVAGWAAALPPRKALVFLVLAGLAIATLVGASPRQLESEAKGTTQRTGGS